MSSWTFYHRRLCDLPFFHGSTPSGGVRQCRSLPPCCAGLQQDVGRWRSSACDSGSTKWSVLRCPKLRNKWCKKTTSDLRKMNVDTHPIRGSCRAIPTKTDGWEQDLPPKLGVFCDSCSTTRLPWGCGSNFQAKEAQMWTPQSWKGFVTIRDCHWWMMAIYLSWVKHLQCL